MSKNKERECRISKGQRKEVKPVKVNKERGNSDKLVGDEKAGKQDDASKKFPNFSLLSEEERQVFFEALTTARKNLEKKGVPTRQRFGTVHDEYLNHFKTEGDSEKPTPRESKSVVEEKPRDGSTTFVPQGGDSPQKNISNEKMKTVPTYCAQIPVSEKAKPEVIQQCESVIQQNTDRIIDLYVKRKKKNEGKFEIPAPGKREKPEKEQSNQAKENVRKLLVAGKTPKSRKTPRFDALSSEEKEVFFKILDEARNNVVERNPGKKNDILPLDSIEKMYQGYRRTNNLYVMSQKTPKQEKNLNLKVTLTSGDVRKVPKNKSYKKVEEQKKEEPKVEEQKKEEPKVEEHKEEEPKVEEQKKEEPKVEEHKEEEPKVEEHKEEEPKVEEHKEEEPKVEEQKEEKPKVEEQMEEEPKVEEQMEEEPKVEQKEEEANVEENLEEKVEEKKIEETIKDVENDNRKERYSKLKEKPASGTKLNESDDSEKAAEEKAPKNVNTEETEASEEKEENSEKHKMQSLDESSSEIPPEKKEVERTECNENEKSKKEEMMEHSCDEENSEKVTKKESQESQGKENRSASSMIFPEDHKSFSRQEKSSRSKLKETESVEETAKNKHEWILEKQRDSFTSSSPKVMFVEDNVIDKIRNLILYLEVKARKNDRLEKEYIKLLVDYVDYLSRMLEALMLKKNRRQVPFKLQKTFVDAEVHLKFNDDPAAQKSQKTTRHLIPRSVSEQAVGGNFLSAISHDNVPEKITHEERESDIETTMSRSNASVTSLVSEDTAFIPPPSGSKRVGITKIRLLQDLLKKRAEFVEGEDLKIVHHPEEEYIPVDRHLSMKAIASESESRARVDNRVKFLRFLTKCFTCGKKKEEEYGVFENLKGEAVRVVVSEKKNKDPANATLNPSVMEVLKATGRKKVIEKFYGKN